MQARCLIQDLADPALSEVLLEATKNLELGVLVYNAAYVPVGPFWETDEEALERLVRVNVHGPTILLRSLLPPMCERRRGAVVLMSSLAGLQGTPRFTIYAASKAFNTTLAEGLWAELREKNIDVLACCSGAVPTPGYQRAFKSNALGMLTSEQVASRTLDALGKGPRFVPGLVNRIAAQISSRILSRKSAINLIHKNILKIT